MPGVGARSAGGVPGGGAGSAGKCRKIVLFHSQRGANEHRASESPGLFHSRPDQTSAFAQAQYRTKMIVIRPTRNRKKCPETPHRQNLSPLGSTIAYLVKGQKESRIERIPYCRKNPVLSSDHRRLLQALHCKHYVPLQLDRPQVFLVLLRRNQPPGIL